MLYCQNCGASMSESANFCPNCGTSVSGADTSSGMSDTAKTIFTAAGTAAGVSFLGNLFRRRRGRRYYPMGMGGIGMGMHHRPHTPPPPHAGRRHGPHGMGGPGGGHRGPGGHR